MMFLDDFQKETLRTVNPALDQRDRQHLMVYGLAGETGEAIDHLKKAFFHGQPLDREKLKKELGDVLWYVAGLAAAFDFSLDEIAQENVRKLRARYPDGFEVARAKHNGD